MDVGVNIAETPWDVPKLIKVIQKANYII